MQSSAQPIKLTVRGLGHVPSFKNSKQLAIRGNRPLTFTKKEYAETMDQIIQSIASQLLSEYQTREIATSTGLSLPSWIASCMPLDDSRKWIIDERVVLEIVPPGQEGADIIIEKVEPPQRE